MKVYLTKDIEKVGLSGEIVKVTDGFGRNFIIARGSGIEVTDKNEQFYQNKSRTVELLFWLKKLKILKLLLSVKCTMMVNFMVQYLR